jgi:subtilisin family serine protease
LIKINNLGRYIKYCRPYYQPYTFNASASITPEDSVKTGLVITQGDTMIRTNLVRPGFKINGDGIKIGVISDSYGTIPTGNVAIPPYNPAPGPIPQSFNITTLRQDITNGEVPSDTTLQIPNSSGIGTHDTLIKNSYGFAHNVHVLQDFPQQRSDEGRAMIQIIHDVAPAAEIYFNSGFFTAGEFAKTIKRLRDAGCKIIVDDVTFPTEPFLRDGIIAKTADSVVRYNNVTYISSAGNFADQAYESDFVPTDASSLTGFNGLKAHNFGGGDMFQQILLRPGKYTFVFQWLDSTYSRGETLTGTKYNMDCFLSRQTNGGGLIGFNRDNTGGDPIEFIPIEILPDYPNDTTSKIYNLLIVNNTTTGDPARIKYIIYKRDAKANIGYISHRNLPGVSVSTITGQANADSVISVGAARFNHTIDRYTLTPHPLLPDNLIGITKPQLESFSSIGGGKIENIIRNKPNVTGSDGGNTTVKLGQDYPNNALDGFSNFFGTSAAAPHVAAAAALIMQGRKKFLAGHPNTSPWEIKDVLQQTAFDMETPGYDLKSGYGLIDADSAMRIYARPTPFEIKLIVPPGTVPGQSTFQLTITGQNFSSNSYVVVGDTTLINGVRDTTQYWPDAITRNQILVTLNTFDGNPPIMVYTPPKTAFGDAGYSNILYSSTEGL